MPAEGGCSCSLPTAAPALPRMRWLCPVRHAGEAGQAFTSISGAVAALGSLGRRAVLQAGGRARCGRPVEPNLPPLSRPRRQAASSGAVSWLQVASVGSGGRAAALAAQGRRHGLQVGCRRQSSPRCRRLRPLTAASCSPSPLPKEQIIVTGGVVQWCKSAAAGWVVSGRGPPPGQRPTCFRLSLCCPTEGCGHAGVVAAGTDVLKWRP